MAWLQKMVFPVKRVWDRVKPRKIHSSGLVKLHADIQTCGYEDVQVMWEMLRKSDSKSVQNHPKRKHRPLWRVFLSHSAASSVPKSA